MVKLTSPVFAVIFVFGNDVAAGDNLGQVNHAIKCSVDHQTRNKTVGRAVSEGNEHHGYEGWNRIADVPPIGRGDLSHHEAANLCFC